MIELILGAVIGFAFGYGIREYISRRRHAAAREHFFQQHRVAENSGFAESQQRPLSQQEHIDRLKLIATRGLHADR